MGPGASSDLALMPLLQSPPTSPSPLRIRASRFVYERTSVYASAPHRTKATPARPRSQTNPPSRSPSLGLSSARASASAQARSRRRPCAPRVWTKTMRRAWPVLRCAARRARRPASAPRSARARPRSTTRRPRRTSRTALCTTRSRARGWTPRWALRAGRRPRLPVLHRLRLHITIHEGTMASHPQLLGMSTRRRHLFRTTMARRPLARTR